MPITEVVDGLIDLIQENLIAKTNLISSALTGQVLINVENSFNYNDGEEVVIVDYGYNDTSSPHYNLYERVVIKEVNNTHWITLDEVIEDPNGGWLLSEDAFIQKAIGHSPLYD